jgi:rSAM/selenodomain-associated transferase 1
MRTVAVAIICKTPTAGLSKTRLSPPLASEECAAISRCFIMDLSATIQSLVDDGDVTGYAVYMPFGSEEELRELLPESFRLTLQGDGDLGARLLRGTSDLLNAGHGGAILVNSDSPTLPKSILRRAVDAVRQGDNVTLCPAIDGGYTLIGLSKPHAHLFADIPWSTDVVYRLTLERARAIGLKVVSVPAWYDVDDTASLAMLEEEMILGRPRFAEAEMSGADAPMTRRFLRERQSLVRSA